MKKLACLFFAILFVAACDYKIALVQKPSIKIDKKLIGVWERSNDQGKIEKLLILPLNEYEYLISFPAESKNSMFAKACFFKCSGKTLVQLCWLGTSKGVISNDGRDFQYAVYTIKNNQLRASLLNTAVVNKNIASDSELVNAIKKNINDPKLFKKPMVFERTMKKTAKNNKEPIK